MIQVYEVRFLEGMVKKLCNEDGRRILGSAVNTIFNLLELFALHPICRLLLCLFFRSFRLLNQICPKKQRFFLYTLVARSTVPAIFNDGNGGPYLVKGNRFGKHNVALLGSGELISAG